MEGPKVQDPVAAPPTYVDIQTGYVNRFLDGMIGVNYIPNIYDCVNASRWALNDLNNTFTGYDAETDGPSSSDVFALTKVISGTVADSAYQCTISTVSGATWFNNKYN